MTEKSTFIRAIDVAAMAFHSHGRDNAEGRSPAWRRRITDLRSSTLLPNSLPTLTSTQIAVKLSHIFGREIVHVKETTLEQLALTSIYDEDMTASRSTLCGRLRRYSYPRR